MLTKIDKSIIILILVAAIASLPLVVSGASQQKTSNLLVYKSGKKIASYSLNKDRSIKIKAGNKLFCVVNIKHKQAYIVKSNCKLKICQKMGRITDAGQSIICAPMKLLLQIGNKNQNSLDAVNE